MKIICIGRNYQQHLNELGNNVPEEPVFFMKPDSAILNNNKPFFIPDFTKEVHHELELVIKINRLGKHINKKFAHRYYNEVGLGIDFTARDIQQQNIQQGLPWEKAKAFDGSAPLGKFIPVERFVNIQDLNFKLLVNGECRQRGNTNQMIFTIDEIIAYVSRFLTLKIGDLIFTGTPAGVASVVINDRLEGFLEGEKLFDFIVK